MAAYSLKAIRVPFPSADSAAAAAAGTNTSDGIAPPAKTIEGQRWLGGHGGGGGGVPYQTAHTGLSENGIVTK